MSAEIRHNLMKVKDKVAVDRWATTKPLPVADITKEQMRRFNDLYGMAHHPQLGFQLMQVLMENGVAVEEKVYRNYHKYGQDTIVASVELRVALQDYLQQRGVGVLTPGNRSYMVFHDINGIMGYGLDAAFRNMVVSYNFVITATPELHELLVDFMAQHLNNIKPKSVKRVVVQGDSLRTETVLVPETDITPIDISANYPFFTQTPAELWEDFSRSSSHVLPMIGQPGTGKTSYSRALIDARGWDRRIFLIDNIVTLNHPGLLDYIRNMPPGSLVICEDADQLLAKREDGNAMMAALLNTTSGLATCDIKFMIITNLKSTSKMDDAILRVGRNYRTLMFKELSRDQAHTVRENMQLPPVDITEDKLVLAEVIHYKSNLQEENGKQPFGYNGK